MAIIHPHTPTIPALPSLAIALGENDYLPVAHLPPGLLDVLAERKSNLSDRPGIDWDCYNDAYLAQTPMARALGGSQQLTGGRVGRAIGRPRHYT